MRLGQQPCLSQNVPVSDGALTGQPLRGELGCFQPSVQLRAGFVERRLPEEALRARRCVFRQMASAYNLRRSNGRFGDL